MQSKERHDEYADRLSTEVNAIRLSTVRKQSRGRSKDIQSKIDKDEDVKMKLAVPLPTQIVSVTGATLGSDDVWVYASLLDANSNSATREDLLGGQRAGSVHPLRSGQGLGGDTAYAALPDLVVTMTGRYRFRLTAIDMKYSQQGRVLAAITSEAFEVVEKTENLQANGPVDAALRRLQELGVQF